MVTFVDQPDPNTEARLNSRLSLSWQIHMNQCKNNWYVHVVTQNYTLKNGNSKHADLQGINYTVNVEHQCINGTERINISFELDISEAVEEIIPFVAIKMRINRELFKSERIFINVINETTAPTPVQGGTISTIMPTTHNSCKSIIYSGPALFLLCIISCLVALL